MSADVDLYERGKNGSLTFTFGGERLHNALEKIAKMCTLADGKIYFNNDDLSNPIGYMSLFAADRALFLTCELKSAMQERAMESTFGLVPMPKLDEKQENYRSLVTYTTEFLTIPKTQDKLSEAGLILDALTYESWRDVLPVYYDITVSQKGLRNAESIEMMQILRDSRSIDFTRVFPIATDLGEALRMLVTDGAGDVSGAASVIESGKSAAEAELQKVLDAMKNNK
jgi:hypothetical protein